jgi:hypothetical protein
MILNAQTQTLVTPYPWVWAGDPALDRGKEGSDRRKAFGAAYQAYLDHGDIGTHLGPYLRSGEQPAQFILRHLRGRTRQWLLDRTWAPDGTVSNEGLYLAGALALVETKNLLFEGEPFKVRRSVRQEQEMVVEEQMDILLQVAGGGLVADLGLHVLTQVTNTGPFTRR